MTMYKLLMPDMCSMYGNLGPWVIGEPKTATGASPYLCSDGLLHCYKTPLQAAVFNILHAGIMDPLCFEIKCSEILDSHRMKHGCKTQTLVRQVELPKVEAWVLLEVCERLLLVRFPRPLQERLRAWNILANAWQDFLRVGAEHRDARLAATYSRLRQYYALQTEAIETSPLSMRSRLGFWVDLIRLLTEILATSTLDPDQFDTLYQQAKETGYDKEERP